ncbi:MAG: type II toxin-antitoxin system RelE/ParE family toxin [Candidatus Sulfotelmatobacter sp.]
MAPRRKRSGAPARAKGCLLRIYHLEKLEDDRQGQHNIRINDQYRVCFVWRDQDAFDVEVTDYHK